MAASCLGEVHTPPKERATLGLWCTPTSAGMELLVHLCAVFIIAQM